MRRLAPWGLCCLIACGADLGALGGLSAPSGHFVANGRVAASTRVGNPMNDQGVLLGAAVESRAEVDFGSRWEGGVMLGWGQGPAALGGGPLGFESFAEFGTSLRNTWFRHGDLYFGAAVALPIHFGSSRQIVDLNERTFILRRRFELVPMLRARVHVDHPGGGPADLRTDLSLGLLVRFRALSDLL